MNVLPVLSAALLIVPAWPAPPVDAADLLRRSIAADRENSRHAANYLFREDIIYRRRNPDGQAEAERSRTYEVIYLVDGPYYRLVARNGLPLPPEDEAAEVAKMDREAETRRRDPGMRSENLNPRKDRFSVPYAKLAEFHKVRFQGEETVSGRPTYVLVAEPRSRSEVSSDLDRYVRTMRVRVWIDRETLVRLRMRAEAVRKSPWLPKGHIIQYDYGLVNNEIWLIHRIQLRVPLKQPKGSWQETDQRYSNYRKFQSDSRMFAGEELP